MDPFTNRQMSFSATIFFNSRNLLVGGSLIFGVRELMHCLGAKFFNSGGRTLSLVTPVFSIVSLL